MFRAMHDMRARIILADDFTSDKVIGAILFERTMHDTINDTPVAQLLWNTRGVVPFLKIDDGLAEAVRDSRVTVHFPPASAVVDFT